jgi:outer membrane protein
MQSWAECWCRSVRAALAVVIATGLSWLSPAHAAEPIAIVDVQKVVNESIIGKAAKSNLEREMQKAKVKLSNLQTEFEKQKGELEKQAAVMSKAALEDRKDALMKKQQEVQRAYQDSQEQLAKINDREIRKVVDEINKVVKGLADDRNYEFVFERDRQAIVYSSSRIDITQEVIKLLDKKKVDL